ncbi:MAG TPA: YcxB family protein [Polyangiaceae bacterium]|nr:YcxB family protein [Polyangiaceae bacterium]
MSERHPERPAPSLADCSFGCCNLVLADFVHAIRHEPRTRALLRWATLGGAVSTPLGIWLLTTPHVASGAVALALGVACFAAHNAPEHAAARWYRQTPPRARLMRYTLNADALIVASELSTRAYPWTSLLGHHQAPESFLVWVDARSFLIVPKRAFEAAELPRVATRLAREVGGPPPLSPLWARLLAGAAAVLALWWLWNWLAPR